MSELFVIPSQETPQFIAHVFLSILDISLEFNNLHVSDEFE